MQDGLTKQQKRRIRELAAIAHERELARELGLVETEFARWRRGEIDAHALSDVIHKFHDGAARRFYSVYAGDVIEMAVGSAIARGVLTHDEASPEILEVLARHIQFAQEIGGLAEPNRRRRPTGR